MPNKITDRRKKIDSTVDKAVKGTPKKKKKAVVKNPYPKDSYRAKVWARKQKEKK